MAFVQRRNTVYAYHVSYCFTGAQTALNSRYALKGGNWHKKADDDMEIKVRFVHGFNLYKEAKSDIATGG